MKKLLPFLFVIFTAFESNAQEINFSIVKKDIECNDQEFGKIEINVVPTNPPYTYSWVSGQTTPMIEGLSGGNYYCTITDNAGRDTLVIVFIGRLDCNMVPAQVITPNGDGINDVWSISYSEYFPNARVIVYNRLGQRVFEHVGIYEPWDAKDLAGVPVPDAAYFYVIWPKEHDDRSIIKGSVTVIR